MVFSCFWVFSFVHISNVTSSLLHTDPFTGHNGNRVDSSFNTGPVGYFCVIYGLMLIRSHPVSGTVCFHAASFHTGLRPVRTLDDLQLDSGTHTWNIYIHVDKINWTVGSVQRTRIGTRTPSLKTASHPLPSVGSSLTQSSTFKKYELGSKLLNIFVFVKTGWYLGLIVKAADEMNT